ncbi:hypothetical protein TNCV_319061 [Trichonephila clavipes]|nr:hypothetical protein TNCV_319061 [Trichonephila clavipes]
MIRDNGPQFILEVSEHLSNILGIKHVKTVVYRPQSNRTERVNRDLLQMLPSFINDNHETWDQFLGEVAYAPCERQFKRPQERPQQSYFWVENLLLRAPCHLYLHRFANAAK